jgi:DNA-binding CsgD family transcriptional regulator
MPIYSSSHSLAQHFIKLTPLINEICSPLYNHLNIPGFGYLRVYNDCQYLALMNGYTEYYQKHLELVDCQDMEFQNAFRKIIHGQPSFLLWQQKYEVDPLVVSLRKEYGVCNGFSIQFRGKDFVEDFSFWLGKDRENQSNFFISNSQLLLKFCNHFRIKIRELINIEDVSELPSYKNKFSIAISEDTLAYRNKFIDQLNKNRSIVNFHNEIVTLTPREYDCILNMMKNKTAKEIGVILDISYRTVEHYIENIKQKLGVNFKSELIEILNRNNIL